MFEILCEAVTQSRTSCHGGKTCRLSGTANRDAQPRSLSLWQCVDHGFDGLDVAQVGGSGRQSSGRIDADAEVAYFVQEGQLIREDVVHIAACHAVVWDIPDQIHRGRIMDPAQRQRRCQQ